jgi:hypothetical protein
MTHRRRFRSSSLLLWFGLLGAPLAWTVHLVLGYWISEIGCSQGGDRGLAIDGWTIVATAIAAALAIAAELAAIKTFLAARPAGEKRGSEEPPPRGRVYFLAVVGMTVAPLFFFIIVMSGVGVAILQNCHQG